MESRERLAEALRHLLDAVGNYVEGDGDQTKLKAACDQARRALRPADLLRGGVGKTLTASANVVSGVGWRTDPRDE